MKNNASKTELKKEYIKSINFGKINLIEPTITTNEENFIEILKNDLSNKFKTSNTYKIDSIYDKKQEMVIPRKENLVFTKLSSSDNHFFGNFSRISDKKDVLTDIIDTASREKINPENIYFEHNTLFYIDFSLKAISFIKTTYIKNVYPYLEELINHNNMINLKIFPLIKNSKEIEELRLTKLTFQCSQINNSDNTDFEELSIIENMGCSIKNYTLSINFKQTNKDFFKKFSDFFSKDKDKFKKISATTSDEIINLIDKTFTKSIPIIISNNYEKNYATIEKTLMEVLFETIKS